METAQAQVLGQVRSLRTLCADTAHGPIRDAFLSRLDEEIDCLDGDRARITLIALTPVDASSLQRVAQGLIDGPLADAAVISGSVLGVIADMPPGARPSRAATRRVQHWPLAGEARSRGIHCVHGVFSAAAVFASPVLYGRLLEQSDLLVFVGAAAMPDASLIAGIKRLSEACRYAMQWHGQGEADALTAYVKSFFREWKTLTSSAVGGDFLTEVWAGIALEERRAMMAAGALARLGVLADLLYKTVQAELATLKFRQGESSRLRRGEDETEAAGGLREQMEMLKAMLEEWVSTRKQELTQANEDGVLPFDPRLLASKLTHHDLLHREDVSPAVIKYPWLNAPFFHPLITHEYALLPDPTAIEGIRSRLVTALDVQVRKDVEMLNQHAGALTDRVRRASELYPQFAGALKAIRLPVLARSDFDRPLNSVVLEMEVEDKFVRHGFFKRLMEGRMVASMAFSFVTMAAGVFVLFGDPSIKRGLMKFSGVIVIMMVIYFIFSLLVKAEEEKKELEERLERIRAQINQEVARPLAKVQQTVIKTYVTFVDEVRDAFLAVIETVSKAKAGERARVLEQRKTEDELFKGFFQRRQQAATALMQKVPQFLTSLERVRVESEKPVAAAPSAVRPAMGAVRSSAPASMQPTAASPAIPAPPARMSASERLGLTATERIAMMKAAQTAAVANAESGTAAASTSAASSAAESTKPNTN